MSGYAAIVCPIQTRPHPNADRLQLGTAHGYQVVVDLDTVDGELGVFFPSDGQLSEQMCAANDLIGWTDVHGVRHGGFFAKNRRVRSQRFRGEKSEGYWTPLSALRWTGFDVAGLADGMTFTELNGQPVCNKYVTPATARAARQQTRKRLEVPTFPKHVDTEQLKYHLDDIDSSAVLWFTEKTHGTSNAAGMVLVARDPKRTWLDRLLRRNREPVTGYEFLVRSRNVILDEQAPDGFYGDTRFRFEAVERLRGNLRKGEVIYGELVGWVDSETPIMATQSTKELPETRKLYGDTITYTYGQVPGACEFLVYRITRVNEDGDAVDLSWPAVKARSEVLGLRTVPELAGPIIASTLGSDGIERLATAHESGPSMLCDTHPREGVAVRAESVDVKFFKQKNFEFGVMEGYLKADADYVDLEEAA